MAVAIIAVIGCCSLSSILGSGGLLYSGVFSPEEKPEKEENILGGVDWEFLAKSKWITAVRIGRDFTNQSGPIELKSITLFDPDGNEIVRDIEITNSDGTNILRANPKSNDNSWIEIKLDPKKQVGDVVFEPKEGCENSILGATIEALDSMNQPYGKYTIKGKKDKYTWNWSKNNDNTSSMGNGYNGSCGISNGISLIGSDADTCLNNCYAFSRAWNSKANCDSSPECESASEVLNKFSEGSGTRVTAESADMDGYCEISENSCNFYKTNDFTMNDYSCSNVDNTTCIKIR
tara:strand:+ start:1472 stop:2344 length:873 start_codon:yes stop_codon:yes gene_type:complete